MTPQTQTVTWHPRAPFGNCWQYALASILDTPADELPDQIAVELRARQTPDDPHGSAAFDAAVRTYLARHHGCAVRSIPLGGVADLRARADRLERPYLLFGPTPRTAISDVSHVVVGKGAGVIWDPHPSRAGLVGVTRADVIVPGSWLGPGRCWCPRCGGVPR